MSTVSNLNRWAPWYATADEQRGYADGDQSSYLAAAEWLKGLPTEDWGCGYAWFRHLHDGPYIGIDGTPSRWSDLVVDLADYRSSTPGLLLRHVLEHDHRWAEILDNAVASFTQRMCIILFTPVAEQTHVIAENVGGLGVPDISFRLSDITDRLHAYEWSVEHLATGAAYGTETMLRVEG